MGSGVIRAGVLAPSYRAHNQERFLSLHDRFRKRAIRRLVRQILFTGEEAEEGPPLRRVVIANRPAQDWISLLERIQDSSLSHLA